MLRRILVGVSLVTILVSGLDASSLAASREQEDERFGVLCALSSELLIGQPHEYPGGTSGITRSLDDTQELGQVDYATFFQTDDPSRFGNFDMLLGHINDLNGGIVPDRDVAILILDDFSVRQAQNQLRSHGEYVFEVAQRILSANFQPVPPQLPTAGAYRETQYLDGHLKLIAIDAPFYNLETMFGVLANVVSDLRLAAQGQGREVSFVVNMSFAMFPCAWLQGTDREEALRLPVVPGEQYPFLHDHDLIVPFEDPSSGNQPLWLVIDANSPEFTGAGLASGDIIEQFGFPSGPDGSAWLSLNGKALSGLLVSADPTQSVGLRVRGKPYQEVSPIALYKALLGDSVAMRRAEVGLENAGVPQEGMLPRKLAAVLEQERLRMAQELRLEPISFDVFLSRVPGDTVLVAAAGNFDGVEPLYPAAYDNVISVAGSITRQEFEIVASNGSWAHVTLDPTVTRWPDSNSGQLMAPAGWYGVPCTVGGEGSLCGAGGRGDGVEYVSGTSFAAPATSVLIGLSLLQGVCDPAGVAAIATWPNDHTFFFGAYCRSLP